jgi:hypothetical protein
MVCHLLVDPDGSEHPGFQTAPFLADDGGTPPEGWHGSAEMVIAADMVRKGPYDDANSNHETQGSDFHRDSALCATCHDVSNPVTGDLAPFNGAHTPLADGTSGVPGSPVDGKAAFNHAPFAFGVVERTSSEHAASAFASLRVEDYPSLPSELRAGALEDAYQAAMASTPTGDYADGDPRLFSCESCHMPPAPGKGAKQAFSPFRVDIPRHDLNGANTWAPEAIQWLDERGLLVLGGGLSNDQRAALDAGVERARANLRAAAALAVEDDELKVVNLTGHKLPTGFPEGRRMWLETTWLGPDEQVLRTDGAYGALEVTHEGQPLVVETLLDPYDPNLKLWHVHMGLTQEWANTLLALGHDPNLPLSYDRTDGAVEYTLGDLAALPAGSKLESFRFVLNDTVVEDGRIPPFGFDRDEAFARNCQPIPSDQFGDPASGGTYEHYDEVELDPPVGAASARFRLLYQTTSWEYVQFLALADPGQSAFLGGAADDLLDAWLATGMSPPEEMATAEWTAPPGDCDHDGVPDAAQIAQGTGLDCDGDGVLDVCRLALDPAADLDGDGGLDVCQWLSADVAELSMAAGGTQALALHADPARAGEPYLLLGSLTGTVPATPVGGGVALPLVVDDWFQFTLVNPNTPPLQGSFGLLDASAAASAAFVLPSGLTEPLAGLTVHHAFVTFDAVALAPTGASNPVGLTFVP